VRKTHEAFTACLAAGRLIAEYDFVYDDANVAFEEGDWAGEISHGTKVWSVAAGEAPGQLYGPAYQANVILCKTEDIRSETDAEEDNWAAAVEFADSVGADVISTSVGYMIFDDSCQCDHTYEDMDGQTTTISIAASMCDGLGIVLAKSVGNSGPASGSVTAPADAFDILAVGGVTSTGSIYASSSRGPTYDGRIKPEVCARALSTRAAHPSYDNVYSDYSGTSFAAPLIAGAACLLIEAHPNWTPYQVREALKLSGNNADSPDNTFGWGIPDVDAALTMGSNCCEGKVGNIVTSNVGPPDISDVSALVDYLYIDGTPIDCLAEADINQSGGDLPLPGHITIGDIAMLIDHLYISHQPLADCQ
jgi:subtilisin family serine protease